MKLSELKIVKYFKEKKSNVCVNHRYAPIDIWGDYEDEYGRSYWEHICTNCGKRKMKYNLTQNILREVDVDHLLKILKEKK